MDEPGMTTINDNKCNNVFVFALGGRALMGVRN